MRLGRLLLIAAACGGGPACSGKVESGSRGDAGVGPDAGSDADSDADTDSDSDTDADTDADSDTDADAGPGIDCGGYCEHELECNPKGVLDDCLSQCDCDVSVILRPDIQPTYFDCMTTTDCSDAGRLASCRAAASDGIEPSDEAAATIEACEARPECAIPCDVAILLTDGALAALRPCIDAATCEEVNACIAGGFSGLCASE